MHSQDQDVANGTSPQAVPDLGQPETGDEDIIVAEVIEAHPGDLAGADSGRLDDELDSDDELDLDDELSLDDEFAAHSEPPASLDAMTPPGASPDLSQQWHDIQAAFVDDPPAAVRRATEAAEAAISALATGLQSQMNDLTSPRGDGDGDGQDTERLRVAMQRCRVVWQGVQDITASSVSGAA